MAVEQAVGTKENDLQALRNATLGAHGWNSLNLGHVFGQAPVNAVNQNIAAEMRMRDTYGKVTQNAEPRGGPRYVHHRFYDHCA